jgi:hypothetical protein
MGPEKWKGDADCRKQRRKEAISGVRVAREARMGQKSTFCTRNIRDPGDPGFPIC